MKNSINKINTDESNRLIVYEELADTITKTLVFVQNYIEKYEKENYSEHINITARAWNELCLEVHCELKEGTKIKEDLDDANTRMKQMKLEKI